MPSHLACIGLPVTSSKELEQYAERAVKEAEIFGTPAGRYFRWRSSSGAELWLQVDRKRRLMGASPHFSGAGRLRVGITRWLRRDDDSELDGGCQGWAAPGARGNPDTGLYPLAFDVPDAARHLGLAVPREEDVQLTAFCHRLTVWPDEAAHREACQAADGPAESPPRAFIPSGLFSPQGEPVAVPASQGIVTAVAQHAERLENELMGDAFYWLLVECPGGTLDLVAAPEVLEQVPPVGAVVRGACWLSGRLVAHDKARRSWLDRLRYR